MASFNWLELLEGSEDRSGIQDLWKFNNFSILIELWSCQCGNSVKMTHYRYSLVFFPIFCQQLFDFPSSHAQLLRRLIYYFRLKQLQQFMLFFLVTHLPLCLEVLPTGIFDMLAQILHKPQLRVVLHEGKIKMRKLLWFLFDVMTDIARIPKYFSENGMHLHFNTPISKNLITCFKCPLIGWYQNNIDIDIP